MGKYFFTALYVILKELFLPLDIKVAGMCWLCNFLPLLFLELENNGISKWKSFSCFCTYSVNRNGEFNRKSILRRKIKTKFITKCEKLTKLFLHIKWRQISKSSRSWRFQDFVNSFFIILFSLYSEPHPCNHKMFLSCQIWNCSAHCELWLLA